MIFEDCYKENGYYPISFSYPKTPYLYIKEKLIADIVPGNSYSYSDESLYLAEYQKSYYGVTMKKAGWDCMRHLEIMVSGTMPLMADAVQIPKYTMTHHLKELYMDIYERFQRTNEPPSVEERQLISANFINNLTCSAMAKYIMKSAKVTPKNVLFIDQSLPQTEDYLSIMTLIGFKQLFGQKCVEAFITPYLYDNYQMDTKTLYGRGFGYSKVLKANTISGLKNAEDINQFDLIVLGSMTRNPNLIEFLEKQNVPLVYLHGEDFTPQQTGHTSLIHNSRAITFVRESN